MLLQQARQRTHNPTQNVAKSTGGAQALGGANSNFRRKLQANALRLTSLARL